MVCHVRLRLESKLFERRAFLQQHKATLGPEILPVVVNKVAELAQMWEALVPIHSSETETGGLKRGLGLRRRKPLHGLDLPLDPHDALTVSIG